MNKRSGIKAMMLFTLLMSLLSVHVSAGPEKLEYWFTWSYEENNNFTELIKGVAYSPHMPGEGCTEFGNANYSQDFEWMVDAGVNTIRTYDWVPEEILDNATRYDVRVIEGIWIPSDGNFSDESLKESCKTHIKEVVERDRDKDCIIGWCVGNELHVSAVESAGQEETERFLRELNNYTRSLDPDSDHFITHASWPLVDYLDLSFFDIVSFNVYSYWPHAVSHTGYYDYLCELKAKYPDKPLLITEFGYSTSPIGVGNYDYGGNTENMQSEGIKELWSAILGAGCVGGIVFEWNDEWWKNDCFGEDKNTHETDDPEEWFGIIGVEGDPENYTTLKKPAYYTVCEMFGGDNQDPAESIPTGGIVSAIIGLTIATVLTGLKTKRRS